MSSLNYCLVDLGSHTVINCTKDLLNGSSNAFALLGLCHELVGSFDQQAAWDTAEAQADVSKKAYVVKKNINIEMPDATIQEVDNIDQFNGGTIPTGFEILATIEDYNVSEANNTFWESANGQTFDLVVYQPATPGQAIYVKKVMVKASPANLPKPKNEWRRYIITLMATIEANDFPQEITVPEPVFAIA